MKAGAISARLSARDIGTTGPNMLRDVFPYLLDEGEYIESATIQESSRICAVAVDGQPQRSRNGVNFVMSELIAGIGEVAIQAGLTQIVSVFDARIYRVLKAVGCNPQLIGKRGGLAARCVTLGYSTPAKAFSELCRPSARNWASRPPRRWNSLSRSRGYTSRTFDSLITR